jgi:hypothetical protein
VATDNFNRADNADLGTNWTPPTGVTGWSISGNQALEDSGGAFCAEYWNAVSFANDQYSQAIVDGVTLESVVNNGAGVAVRIATGANTMYRAYLNSNASGEIQLTKHVAGVVTELAQYTAGAAPALLDGIRLEVRGTTLKVYHSSAGGAYVERISTDDSSIASGSAGIAGKANSNLNLVDNWDGGDLSAVTTNYGLIPMPASQRMA